MKTQAHNSPVLYYIITVLLMPLLLLQATWVRLRTIKLPEAQGKRIGVCGQGQALKLLVLGDSAAAGVGTNLQEDALTGQLSTLLAVENQIQWHLVAKTGLTSTDIVNELEALPAQKFDLVLVSVGVNDVTHFTHQQQWLNNIHSIVELLNTKFDADQVLFSSVPPMHLFTAIAQPLRWWLGLRAKKLNALMTIAVESIDKCSILTVDLPFRPEYLAKDGVHPSKLAYKVWAEQAAAKFNSV